MLGKHALYKNEIPCKGPCKIIQLWKSGPVTPPIGVKIDRINT